jgi:carboxyl-terminal processing protease
MSADPDRGAIAIRSYQRACYSLVAICLIAALGLVGCGGGFGSLFNRRVTPAAPVDVSPKVAAQLRDFDFAVQSLRELYLRPDALNESWRAVVETARARITYGDGRDQLLIESLQSILEGLNDEEVVLLPPATSQAASTPSPAYAGIGVLVDLPQEGRNRLLILSVYPDSPADRAGLKPHDAIIAIEGEPVTYDKRNELIPKLRGQAGSRVTITVRTPGQRPRDETLTRQPIVPRGSVSYKRLFGTDIGYIAPDASQLSRMRMDTADALRNLTAERDLSGLVLDLRIIRGNDFPLEGMLSLFVNGKVGIVATRNKEEIIEIAGKSIGGSQELPMVVLVSEMTSGQAEAFAGLLQDLGRAQIVGNRTRGLLAEFTTATLPTSRLRLQIPSGDYRSVKGTSWRGKGVTPDVLSEVAWEDFTDENDVHLKQAVELLTSP